jgi:hypothetical protein
MGALYTDPSVGGICVPDSQIKLHATNVIARGGKYDVDVPDLCIRGARRDTWRS